MTKEDMKDLLLGKAIKYLGDKYIKSKDFNYWELINKINLIVEEHIYYESYNMDEMQEDLYHYCKKLRGV